MAGIQDPTVIDLVGQSAEGDYFMAMVEERRWGEDAGQPRQLREKINRYAEWIVDGQLSKLYPETAGRRVGIHLYCAELPTGEILRLTEQARIQLEKLGIGFEVRLTP